MSQYSPPVPSQSPRFDLPCDDTTERIVGSHRITGTVSGFDPAMYDFVVSSDLSSVTFTTIRWELAVAKYGTDVARLMLNRAADGVWVYELVFTDSVTGCGRPIRRYDLTTTHTVETSQGVTISESTLSSVVPGRSPQDVIYTENDVLSIPSTLSDAGPSIREEPTSTMEVVERTGIKRTVVMLYWSDVLNRSVLDRPPQFTDPAPGVYYGGIWALRNESTILPTGELLTDENGELLFTTVDKGQTPMLLTLTDFRLRTAYVRDTTGAYYLQVICTLVEYNRPKTDSEVQTSLNTDVEVVFTPSGDIQVTSGNSVISTPSNNLTQGMVDEFVQPALVNTQVPSLDPAPVNLTPFALEAFGVSDDSVSSAPETPPDYVYDDGY